MFTSADGRKLEAKALKMDERTVTVERRSDKKQFTLELSNISAADRDWLNARAELKPAKQAGGAAGSTTPEEAGDQKLNKSFYPRTRAEIRRRLAEITAREVPPGIGAESAKAVNRLNAYRYLCGVPDAVKADKEMNSQAVEAAKACDANGAWSHELGHFTNICNLWPGNDLAASVDKYMDDFGDNNRENRGHRRWCLNPPMGKTGFGAGTDFSAMVSMDTSGRAIKDSWAYPGKGFFPLEYLKGNAWSLYLTEKVEMDKQPTVEVTRLKERPAKEIAFTEPVAGEKVEIEAVFVYENAINFEPGEVLDPGIYWVRVKATRGVREQYVVELF